MPDKPAKKPDKPAKKPEDNIRRPAAAAKKSGDAARRPAAPTEKSGGAARRPGNTAKNTGDTGRNTYTAVKQPVKYPKRGRRITVTSSGAALVIIILIILYKFVFPTGNENSAANTVNGENAAVHFIDVGQGDSELITVNGHTVLIDSGEAEYAGKVCNYISSLGISRLDLVICTHPHSDHIGSMYKVVSEFETGKIMLPKPKKGETPTTASYTKLLQAAAEKEITVQYAEPGGRYDLTDDCSLEFIAPLTFYDNINNVSVVCRLVHGKNKFLFTGDIETKVEGDILDSGADIRADVIKVAHHGSKTSSSYKFIKAVSPQYAVIEVGSPNDYGHPRQEICDRYKELGCEIYRTDLNGDIVFISDGRTLKVNTAKGSAS